MLTADSILSKLDKQDTKENDCWILPGQDNHLEYPASKKELSDILGLQAKDEYTNVTEEPGMTVQVASSFC